MTGCPHDFEGAVAQIQALAVPDVGRDAPGGDDVFAARDAGRQRPTHVIFGERFIRIRAHRLRDLTASARKAVGIVEIAYVREFARFHPHGQNAYAS